MPTLHVLQGPDKGRSYPALDGSAVIGRSSEQIHLSDGSASRRHAEIRPVNGVWVLFDLDSSNGTFLNGQRLTVPTELKDGDHIKVGGSVLAFTEGEPVDRFIGAAAIHDRVDLDVSHPSTESSILAAVDPSAESVVLPRPETADAVVAWKVVYRIAEMIGTMDSVEAFLERVTDIIVQHLVVDRLVLFLHGDGGDGKTLVPHVVRCRSQDSGQRPKIVASWTIINRVIDSKEGILCANAMTDDRFSADNKHDSIHRFELQSIICVPIIAHDQVHGVIYLDCSMSHHTFNQEQLRLAVAIGRLAGMAFENAELLESRVRTERLAAAGETVAYLSHYIRNVLQGLQGGADVVELGFKKGDLDAARSGWTLVGRNLERIYQLAMNMLTFSKKREPRVETTLINTVVEDVISLVLKQVRERSIKIQLQLEDVPAIPLDAEGIHQVIHNILLNAVQAVLTGSGEISIKTGCCVETNRVVLSIADNGPGIEPEALGTIFDAFQSTKGHGGTGLGLAAAKKIIDELGGELDVESTVGEGTTFHVRLPVDPVLFSETDQDTWPDPAEGRRP